MNRNAVSIRSVHLLFLSMALVAAGCQKEVEKAEDAAKQAAADSKAAAQDAEQAAAEAASAAGKAAEDAAAVTGEAARDAAEAVGEGFSAVADEAEKALKSVEGGSEVLTGLRKMFGSAAETLRGITDKASAEVANSRLDELGAEVDRMAESAAKLPEEAMTAIGSVVEKGIEELKALGDKLVSNSEVHDVIKPKLDELTDKLKKMTGA